MDEECCIYYCPFWKRPCHFGKVNVDRETMDILRRDTEERESEQHHGLRCIAWSGEACRLMAPPVATK